MVVANMLDRGVLMVVLQLEQRIDSCQPNALAAVRVSAAIARRILLSLKYDNSILDLSRWHFVRKSRLVPPAAKPAES